MRRNCYGTFSVTERLRLFGSGTLDWGGSKPKVVWIDVKEKTEKAMVNMTVIRWEIGTEKTKK
jgi:hypothetical protein